MKIRKPKPSNEAVELAGFVALAAAALLLGVFLSGWLLGCTLGLFVSGVLAVLAGNA